MNFFEKQVNCESVLKEKSRELHAMGVNVVGSLLDYVLAVPINGSASGSSKGFFFFSPISIIENFSLTTCIIILFYLNLHIICTPDEYLRKELHESLVPSALRVPWTNDEIPVHLHFYYIKFIPIPADREYRMFGLFVKSPLPREAETMEIDLHRHHSRIVKTALVPSGVRKFDKDQVSCLLLFYWYIDILVFLFFHFNLHLSSLCGNASFSDYACRKISGNVPKSYP